MATPECVEVDIESIIMEVMEKNGITPDDVEEEEPFDIDIFIKNLKKKEKWSQRYFRGRALGQFKCDSAICNNTWSSAFSWCILDLKEQRVEMKFKQECSSPQHKDMEQLQIEEDNLEASESEEDFEAGVEPCYCDEGAVEHMVEWAVNLFMVNTGRKEREATYHNYKYRQTPEHHQGKCEMCKREGKLCFERQ